MSKTLGQHNGLPVTLIVSVSLGELCAMAGVARTAVGTMLSMRDVIRLAGHAEHYLRIYDEHTAEELHLGRTKRLASKGQRLVMIARDGGCTRPGCTATAADCEAHHGHTDWGRGGRTDIDDLTLACDPDNDLAYDGGWTTARGSDGRIHWHPPPLLAVGQDTRKPDP